MRLVCPGCGFTADLEAFLMDAQAREAVLLALKLPAPLGERLLRYIGLFRPEKRALSWDRVVRLLTELLPPIAEAKVERNGRTWPAPLEYWSVALDEIVARRDSLTLPLKSHGYLFEIVAGQANKAEARRETVLEQARQHPAHRDHDPNAGLKRTEVPAEFKALVSKLVRKGGADGDQA